MVLFLLAVVLVGCSPKEPPKAPGEYVGENARLMSELGNNDVILRVNGHDFTKADFLVAVSMQDKIRRMCAGDPLTGENKPAEEYSRWARPRTLSEILRHALVRQYAEKNNITATKEELDVYVSKLLAKLRRKGRTLQSVAEEFGKDEGRLFISYVEDDVLAQPLRNHFDTEHTLNITDEDVIAVSNRIVRYQANAAASNAVERAALEAALAEIKAGGDFAAIAKKYSETPEDGELWGEFLFEEMTDEESLAEWVAGAYKNDVSGILLLDDGMSVVKVVDRHPEDVPFSQQYEERRDIWKLARITRKYYETTEDRTRPEIVRMLTDFRNKKLQKKVGKVIMEQAVIEWPHGTNFFPKAKQSGAKPQGGKKEIKGKKGKRK